MVWQRSFYDHIIRSDREQFFIEQYIAMNPLLWYIDRENPGLTSMNVEELRRELLEEHGLDDDLAEHLLEQLIASREIAHR